MNASSRALAVAPFFVACALVGCGESNVQQPAPSNDAGIEGGHAPDGSASDAADAGDARPGDHDASVAADGGGDARASDPDAGGDTLHVHIVGGGAGKVTSDVLGIACPSQCDAVGTPGTKVTLEAKAQGGSVFAGWEGDCRGTGPCVLTIGTTNDITARFQAPSVAWARSFGGVNEDDVAAMAVSPQGRLGLLGQFTGSVNVGGPTLSPSPTSGGGYFVGVYEAANGAHVWSLPMYGSDVIGIAFASNGDAVVAGRATTSGTIGTTTLTGSSGAPFVARLRADTGVLVWSRILGTGTDKIFGSSMAVAADDTVLIGGFLQQGDFGNGPITAAAEDAFVVALDGVAGATKWATVFPGSGQTRVTTLAASAGGGIVAAGGYGGTVDLAATTLDAKGVASGFVVKLAAATGAVTWTHAAPNGLMDHVALDTNGDLFASGTFTAPLDLGGGPLAVAPPPAAPLAAAPTIFMAKLAGATGAHVWSRAIAPGHGTSTPAGANNRIAALGATGDLYVAGEFVAPLDLGTGSVTYTSSGLEGYVARISGSTGATLGLARLGTACADSADAIAVDAAGNVFAAGLFNGACNLGGTDVSAHGSTDAFVLRLAAGAL